MSSETSHESENMNRTIPSSQASRVPSTYGQSYESSSSRPQTVILGQTTSGPTFRQRNLQHFRREISNDQRVFRIGSPNNVRVVFPGDKSQKTVILKPEYRASSPLTLRLPNTSGGIRMVGSPLIRFSPNIRYPNVRQQIWSHVTQSSVEASSSEIAYDVEHVFIENGREVKKMPIKFGDKTIWVDCVGNTEQETEDRMIFDLMENDTNTGEGATTALMTVTLTTTTASVVTSNTTATTTGVSNTTPSSFVFFNKKEISSDDKEKIIHDVLTNLISPAELSSRHGVAVSKIRDWVKATGAKLPSRYKVKSEKVKNSPISRSQYSLGEPSENFSEEFQNTSSHLVPSSVVTPSLYNIIQSSQSVSIYQPRYIPGKLALCRNCGSTSPDFNKCARCRKPIPENVKVIDDPNMLRRDRLENSLGDPNVSEEPECIAISSEDEDESNSSESKKLGEETQESNTERDKEEKIGNEKVLHDEDEDENDNFESGNFCSLITRSVRIGSYKSTNSERAIFSEKGFQLIVPPLGNENEHFIKITVRKADIVKLLAHFGRGMPIIFIYISPESCKRVRDSVRMTDKKSGPWLDVYSDDETQKRITILPDKMSDDAKNSLLANYGSLIEELDAIAANDLLVRSSPRELVGFKGFGYQISSPKQSPSIKLCVYPTTGSSSVTVTMEDYSVLEDGSFLNDVIIDFYFRYLQFTLFSEVDRERTHIFSTYFYNRLTSRPKKNNHRAHPIEDDPNLTPAEKRYDRVKRWTKKVNLFEKDFVVVPINEHSHWFVAIICFPGLLGASRMDNNNVDDDSLHSSLPQTLKRKTNEKKRGDGSSGLRDRKKILRIGSTTLIRTSVPEGEHHQLSLEEEVSDRDEAEASDDDMMEENDDEENEEKTNENENKETEETRSSSEEPLKNTEHVPIKQPCILIFDSLATGSRARVAATLRDYLKCEYKAKIGREREFTKDNMMGHCPKVPQQPNFTDCGIFLLQYVESFFQTPLSDFTLPLTNLRSMFHSDVVKNKRFEIAKIIRDLSQKQFPSKDIEFPKLSLTPASGSGYTDDDDEENEKYETKKGKEEKNESGEIRSSSRTHHLHLLRVSSSTSSSSKMIRLPSTTTIFPSVQILPSPSPLISKDAHSSPNVSNEEESFNSPDSTSNDLPFGASTLVDYSDSGSDEIHCPDSYIEEHKKRPKGQIDREETHETAKRSKYNSSSSSSPL